MILRVWIGLCAAVLVVVIFAIIFGERRQRHYDLAPITDKAREAAVEIIADGVERGVRRATKGEK